MQHDEFKLDGASLLDRGFPNQRIILFNFNVPADRLPDQAGVERILRQVETDFPPEDRARVVVPLYFQITAVYTLVHRETGEERLWQGSFNPRSRDLGQVTVFRPFDPQTFVQYTSTRCTVENVLHQLQNRADGRESVWIVDRLLSVIVSVQATVRATHAVFTHHPTLQQQQDGGDDNRNRRAVFRLLLD